MNPNMLYDCLIHEGDESQICLQYEEKKVSYGEFRAQIDAWEEILLKKGVPRESRVVLQLPGSFTLLYLMFALWKHGCQIVLMDFRLKPSETNELMRLCEPDYRVHVTGKPALAFKDSLDVTIDLVSKGQSKPMNHVLVQFTSASTGQSKVVGRTAQDILNDIDRVVTAEKSISSADRVLVLSSMSHTYGLLTAILPTLNQGGTLVFCSTPQPHDVLASIHRDRITVLAGVPFHYELLVHSSYDDKPWDHVKMALSAGEMMNPSTVSHMREKYGVSVGQVYGMTETGIISADFAGEFPGSAGKVLKGLELDLRDGEIFIKLKANPYLISDNGDRFINNWLRTQDVGEMDHTNQILTIRGRTSSIAVIGGLKVNLLEVEQVLNRHDAVLTSVVSSSASGKIEAFLELKNPVATDVLLIWCKEMLANYKIPSAFHFVDSIPRTVTGKLSRNSQVLSNLKSLATVHKEGSP